MDTASTGQKGKYEVMTGTLKKPLPSSYCSDRSLEERDQKRITVFGTTDGESSDDSLADLGCTVHQNPAVGVGGQVYQTGRSVSWRRVTKYCRLLSIEDELAQQGALGPAEKHEFPVLTEETEADPLSQA